MSSKKRTIDYFDDDFEVTYTDDLPEINLDFDADARYAETGRHGGYGGAGSNYDDYDDADDDYDDYSDTNDKYGDYSDADDGYDDYDSVDDDYDDYDGAADDYDDYDDYDSAAKDYNYYDGAAENYGGYGAGCARGSGSSSRRARRANNSPDYGSSSVSRTGTPGSKKPRDARNHNASRQSRDSQPAGRKNASSSGLASPLRGPIRTTTRLVENITHFILRPAPAVLAALITLITVFTFWTGHSAYGDLSSIAAEGNYNLAAYLAVGGILALWEVSSFFFALSGFHSGTGRGLTFFILVYIGSYAASVAGNLIPDSLPAALPVIAGVKGGLASFGSLYSMLFPLCAAGIVTCILKNILKD